MNLASSSASSAPARCPVLAAEHGVQLAAARGTVEAFDGVAEP